MKAFLALRFSHTERVEAIKRGLRRVGVTEFMSGDCFDSAACDMLVTWNRVGDIDQVASRFEQTGRPVIVLENSSFGCNDFAGDSWLHVASGYHNVAGLYPVGGAERWDSLGVELEPWRPEGGETVVLPSRSIGPHATRMPRDWPLRQVGRVRAHPGTRPCIPLRDDLARASRVVTWGSAAAIQACMWGIRVEWHMPGWIGQHEANDASRLAMLRQLAWGQARMSEIESGEAFSRILEWRK